MCQVIALLRSHVHANWGVMFHKHGAPGQCVLQPPPKGTGLFLGAAGMYNINVDGVNVTMRLRSKLEGR